MPAADRVARSCTPPFQPFLFTVAVATEEPLGVLNFRLFNHFAQAQGNLLPSLTNPKEAPEKDGQRRIARVCMVFARFFSSSPPPRSPPLFKRAR